MSQLYWSTSASWAVFGIGLLFCVTFLATVVLTQRHYRMLAKNRLTLDMRDKDIELAELTERQVNGRDADDVIDMAKAIERQAKAELKLAEAAERRSKALPMEK